MQNLKIPQKSSKVRKPVIEIKLAFVLIFLIKNKYISFYFSVAHTKLN